MADLKQPDYLPQSVDAESAPPSRSPWIAPRVVDSLIDQTELNIGVGADGGAGASSLS